jgi:hypothetical protein
MMKVIVIENLYAKLKVINVNIRYIQNISFVDAPWIQKKCYDISPYECFTLFNVFDLETHHITLYNL